MNKSKKTERIGQKIITKNGLWEVECIEYKDCNNITIRTQVEIDGVIYNVDKKSFWSSFTSREIHFETLKINNKEYKKCSKCKKIFLIDNFNKGRRICKQCQSKEHKKYREKHKDKRNEQCKEWRKNNKERIKEYNKRQHKEYYKKNKDMVDKKNKEWRENNKEWRNEYEKEYRKNNPEKSFNKHNKRRSKIENQGREITREQWIECHNWFKWKCSYSGEKLKDYDKIKDGNYTFARSVDHIVALDNGGLNEPWNIVPMRLGYNSSKNNKINSLTWYKEQEYFDIDRLNKIVEWQKYAYKKWGGEKFGKLILITDLLED